MAAPQDHLATITRQESNISPDGSSYQYSYETSNGIAAQEQGALNRNEAMEVQVNKRNKSKAKFMLFLFFESNK